MFQKQNQLVGKTTLQWHELPNCPSYSKKPSTSAAFPQQVVTWCTCRQSGDDLKLCKDAEHRQAPRLPHSHLGLLALDSLQILFQIVLYISTPKAPRGHAQKNLRKSHVCASFCARLEDHGGSASEAPRRLCSHVPERQLMLNFYCFKQLLLKFLHKTECT